jgi:hypothetical protein
MRGPHRIQPRVSSRRTPASRAARANAKLATRSPSNPARAATYPGTGSAPGADQRRRILLSRVERKRRVQLRISRTRELQPTISTRPLGTTSSDLGDTERSYRSWARASVVHASPPPLGASRFRTPPFRDLDDLKGRSRRLRSGGSDRDSGLPAAAGVDGRATIVADRL